MSYHLNNSDSVPYSNVSRDMKCKSYFQRNGEHPKIADILQNSNGFRWGNAAIAPKGNIEIVSNIK